MFNNFHVFLIFFKSAHLTLLCLPHLPRCLSLIHVVRAIRKEQRSSWLLVPYTLSIPSHHRLGVHLCVGLIHVTCCTSVSNQILIQAIVTILRYKRSIVYSATFILSGFRAWNWRHLAAVQSRSHIIIITDVTSHWKFVPKISRFISCLAQRVIKSSVNEFRLQISADISRPECHLDILHISLLLL